MSSRKRKFEALLPSYIKGEQLTNQTNSDQQTNKLQRQQENTEKNDNNYQQNYTNNNNNNNDEEGDEFEFPSDIEVTISLLKQGYPFEICGSPAVIYVTQIYSILKDRTMVDREIDKMRNQNLIKLIQLPDNDHAIVHTEDYKSVVDQRISICKAEDQDVLRKFKNQIIDKFKSSQISKTEMSEVYQDKIDDAISSLLRNGFLARGVGGHFADIYFFTFQGLGKSAAAISDGREEVIKILKRRRHGEIKMTQFEKLKFKTQKWCGTQFHLSDMVGKGIVEKFSTPVGEGIRLVKMN